MLGTRGRAPRLPLSADLRDAGAGGDRRRRRGGRGRRPPHVEIMIPLVAYETELRQLREHVVERRRGGDGASAGAEVPYSVGTMIELPRACLIAGHIARHADFFSLRDQRPHPDDDRALARRRRGQLHALLPRRADHRPQPVRGDRRPRRRRAGADRGRARARGQSRAQARRSAASTAATRPASASSTRSGSTTSAARPTGRRSPGSPPPQAAIAETVRLDAELLRRHPRALEPGGDLLHRDVAGEVRRAVLRLHVTAERREAAVVGGAEPLDRDVLGGGDQVVADLLSASRPPG